MRCETPIAETRVHGNPRPRLDAQGYTLRAGSPTQTQVRLEGESRWRRVWVWQFSNAGTTFIKVKGKCLIVDI